MDGLPTLAQTQEDPKPGQTRAGMTPLEPLFHVVPRFPWEKSGVKRLDHSGKRSVKSKVLVKEEILKRTPHD